MLYQHIYMMNQVRWDGNFLPSITKIKTQEDRRGAETY